MNTGSIMFWHASMKPDVPFPCLTFRSDRAHRHAAKLFLQGVSQPGKILNFQGQRMVQEVLNEVFILIVTACSLIIHFLRSCLMDAFS